MENTHEQHVTNIWEHIMPLCSGEQTTTNAAAPVQQETTASANTQSTTTTATMGSTNTGVATKGYAPSEPLASLCSALHNLLPRQVDPEQQPTEGSNAIAMNSAACDEDITVISEKLSALLTCIKDYEAATVDQQQLSKPLLRCVQSFCLTGCVLLHDVTNEGDAGLKRRRSQGDVDGNEAHMEEDAAPAPSSPRSGLKVAKRQVRELMDKTLPGALIRSDVVKPRDIQFLLAPLFALPNAVTAVDAVIESARGFSDAERAEIIDGSKKQRHPVLAGPIKKLVDGLFEHNVDPLPAAISNAWEVMFFDDSESGSADDVVAPAPAKTTATTTTAPSRQKSGATTTNVSPLCSPLMCSAPDYPLPPPPQQGVSMHNSTMDARRTAQRPGPLNTTCRPGTVGNSRNVSRTTSPLMQPAGTSWFPTTATEKPTTAGEHRNVIHDIVSRHNQPTATSLGAGGFPGSAMSSQYSNPRSGVSQVPPTSQRPVPCAAPVTNASTSSMSGGLMLQRRRSSQVIEAQRKQMSQMMQQPAGTRGIAGAGVKASAPRRPLDDATNAPQQVAASAASRYNSRVGLPLSQSQHHTQPSASQLCPQTPPPTVRPFPQASASDPAAAPDASVSVLFGDFNSQTSANNTTSMGQMFRTNSMQDASSATAFMFSSPARPSGSSTAFPDNAIPPSPVQGGVPPSPHLRATSSFEGVPPSPDKL